MSANTSTRAHGDVLTHEQITDTGAGVTKSASIRELASEGLTVSEIAKRLTIRYQHVYNVLKQSQGRLNNVKAPRGNPSPKPPLKVAELLAAGFEQAGGWQIVGEVLTLTTPMSKEVGVYAFAIGGVVQYVGVATGGLKGRLYGYSRPGRGQKTNIRVNDLIRAILANATAVDVLTAMPEGMEWNGLPVHACAGLELGLIKKYDLPWNVRGSG